MFLQAFSLRFFSLLSFLARKKKPLRKIRFESYTYILSACRTAIQMWLTWRERFHSLVTIGIVVFRWLASSRIRIYLPNDNTRGKHGHRFFDNHQLRTCGGVCQGSLLRKLQSSICNLKLETALSVPMTYVCNVFVVTITKTGQYVREREREGEWTESTK